jgi:hypothetical protein
MNNKLFIVSLLNVPFQNSVLNRYFKCEVFPELKIFLPSYLTYLMDLYKKKKWLNFKICAS